MPGIRSPRVSAATNVSIQASVVKLFYLGAVHRWLEDKRIQETDELKRAVRDMIVDSSNEATQYVLDVLTQTTGGFELPAKEMKQWQYQRNAVNRYYSSMGYTNINVNQKTFCEDAYGRERVSRGPKGENRNKLTTDATARLLSEIAMGRAVNQARSTQMMELLKRDFGGDSKDRDDQGRALPELLCRGWPAQSSGRKRVGPARRDTTRPTLNCRMAPGLCWLPSRPITPATAKSFRP
jgi:hypothetical protein